MSCSSPLPLSVLTLLMVLILLWQEELHTNTPGPGLDTWTQIPVTTSNPDYYLTFLPWSCWPQTEQV